MPLYYVRADITKMQTDAIVNAANSTLLGGGGVDGAIHRAAGRGLLDECRTLGGCAVGQAKTTKGYDLPAKYVIHTVGPVWYGGNRGERAALISCYRASLAEAERLGCESVAFPLISSGVYGYPKEQAFAVAVEAITAYLDERADYDPQVFLAFFDDPLDYISRARSARLRAYIDENRSVRRERNAYEASFERLPLKETKKERFLGWTKAAGAMKKPSADLQSEEFSKAPEEEPAQTPLLACAAPQEKPAISLEQRLRQADESFSTSLLRLIDEKGMTDAQCYKKANVDRKLFSKIRSNADYRPSKQTVLAFAVALKLTLPETSALLSKAGFALSGAQKSDIIVSYFIENGEYDVFAINEALFAFDQALLG